MAPFLLYNILMPIVIRINQDNIKKFDDSKTANVLRIILIRTGRIMLLEFILTFITAIAFIVTLLVTNEDEETAWTVFMFGAALMAAIFLVGTVITIFKAVRAALRKRH